MSWNNVLNKFIALKREFVNKFGEERLWDYNGSQNCIMYWANFFPEYKNMFEPLYINEFEDFVLLKYVLLDVTPGFWDAYGGMYRECRSVVLDKKNDCLVLTPFRKFFNVNEIDETAEEEIRKRIAIAKKVEISDKMDGSMQSARFYNGKIVLAGSQALDASNSFRVQIGYELIGDPNYQMMLMDNPNYTFIFELICKEDVHVVTYSDEQRGLYLIGMRDVYTGKEVPYDKVIETARSYGVKHTRVFDKTFDEVFNSLDTKKSYEAEGFVINIDDYKVKLKYNDYVAIHKTLSKMISPNTVIKAVIDGIWDDFYSKIPMAYRKNVDEIAHNVFEYARLKREEILEDYHMCRENYQKFEGNETIDKKSFAIYASEHHKKNMHHLINLYHGKELDLLGNNYKMIKYKEIQEYLQKKANS